MKITLTHYSAIPSRFGYIAPGDIDIDIRIVADGVHYSVTQRAVPLTMVKEVQSRMKRDLVHAVTAAVTKQIGELI